MIRKRRRIIQCWSLLFSLPDDVAVVVVVAFVQPEKLGKNSPFAALKLPGYH